MGKRFWRLLAGLFGACLLAWTPAQGQYYEDTMEPEELGIVDIDALRIPGAVYVGNDVCRQCHEKAYQLWLGTAHSRGFVPLYSPMAMVMGEKMGATADMAIRSGKCLKCHATAYDVPAAYRGPGFRMGEGVSCEKCHGPGGDHVRAFEESGSEVDGNLRLPDESFCRGCHHSKMGHEEIKSKFDSFPKAWQRIAHPMSLECPEEDMEPAELGIWHVEEAAVPEADYVGSAACGHCHEGSYRVWLNTGHARAFGALRTEMGYMMDMQMGVTVGGPAKNGRCLTCHATGHDAPAAYRGDGFRMGQGVGCEKCHGPGGDHVREMHNHEQMEGLGLKQMPTPDSCTTCHKRKRSHEKLDTPRFSYPRAWGVIAH